MNLQMLVVCKHHPLQHNYRLFIESMSVMTYVLLLKLSGSTCFCLQYLWSIKLICMQFLTNNVCRTFLAQKNIAGTSSALWMNFCILPPARKLCSRHCLHEIFREGWQWASEQMIKFRWRSRTDLPDVGPISRHRYALSQ